MQKVKNEQSNDMDTFLAKKERERLVLAVSYKVMPNFGASYCKFQLMLLPLGLGKSKLSSAGAKPLGKTACEPPPVGWIKVNFDGSFVAQDGKAGAGVVARDSGGQIIFTAWSALSRCQGAEEAEAQAGLEGLRLAAQWAQGPVILETDCARIAHAMEAKEDRSILSFILSEAKD